MHEMALIALRRHHLQHSLIFHPCGCPVNSRFECSQTIYVAVERRRNGKESRSSERRVVRVLFRNQQAPEVVEVAESSCLMTVSAPLSMFAPWRKHPWLVRGVSCTSK